MSLYEYKTVAAPRRAEKFRGVARGADSFARTLEEVLTEETREGWEYLRAENLPCEEKGGFFSRRSVTFHSVLIFRRALARRGSQSQSQSQSQPEQSLFASPAAAPAEDPGLAPRRLEPAGPSLGPAER